MLESNRITVHAANRYTMVKCRHNYTTLGVKFLPECYSSRPTRKLQYFSHVRRRNCFEKKRISWEKDQKKRGERARQTRQSGRKWIYRRATDNRIEWRRTVNGQPLERGRLNKGSAVHECKSRRWHRKWSGMREIDPRRRRERVIEKSLKLYQQCTRVSTSDVHVR